MALFETLRDILTPYAEAINSLKTMPKFGITAGQQASLAAGVDLNDITTPGSYKSSSSTRTKTLLNCPVTLAFVMHVHQIAGVTLTFQQLFVTSSSNQYAPIEWRRFKNGSSEWTAWSRWAVNDTILDERLSDTKKELSSHTVRPLTTRPGYNVINGFVPVSEISDRYGLDGVSYNQAQGMASDGDRYIYWVLRGGTVEYGDSHTMLIRKWDTYYNRDAGLHISQIPYGHGEDMAYIPAWCPGLDDGNVNRLYIIDMDRNAPNRTIHIVNADTLEYIKSITTDTIAPSSITEYWLGAGHITFNPHLGKIVVNSIHTDDQSVKRNIIAIYDLNGNYEKGAMFQRRSGTQIGIDCDESYIYIPRYVNSGGSTKLFVYMIDWDLNPIGKFEVPWTYWEVEGFCHIGNDFYTSWIEKDTSKGIKIIKNNILIKHFPTDQTLPINWDNTDGFPLNTYELIENS